MVVIVIYGSDSNYNSFKDNDQSCYVDCNPEVLSSVALGG